MDAPVNGLSSGGNSSGPSGSNGAVNPGSEGTGATTAPAAPAGPVKPVHRNVSSKNAIVYNAVQVRFHQI